MSEFKFRSVFSRLLKGLYIAGVAGGAAHAQVSDSETRVNTTIEQIGTGNIAVVTSTDTNYTHVTQSGSGNTASIKMNGAGNGQDDGLVDQSGENNDATIGIDGDDNNFRVEQTGDGATNRATLRQDAVKGINRNKHR